MAGLIVMPLLWPHALEAITQTSKEGEQQRESGLIVPGDARGYLLFHINYVYRPGGEGDFLPLTNGSVLHSGDHYKIIFTPAEKCYVYIIQVDSANKIYQLFPMERFGGVTVNNFNPVEPGRRYYIPGEAKSFHLDEQTGTEKIYFLASRERDEQLEADYQHYLHAEQQQRAAQEDTLEWQLEQVDRLLARARSIQSTSRIVAAPKTAETTTWQEDGQSFSVLRQRLENMCDGCVYVLTFEHR